MAKQGYCYTVTMKETHLGWGTHRYTDSRPLIYGECYIPIPKDVAKECGLLNQNGTHEMDVFGDNLFECESADGFYQGILKAQGSTAAGDPYAKQFAENNNLKGLGRWFSQVDMQVGDKVKVTWETTRKVIIEKL